MKVYGGSRRLAAVAGMCGRGACLADVGCDHAYLSIGLVADGSFGRAIAADLRPGPLCAAREHVLREGLSDRIECRLSDGLGAIEVGEADTLVCAGMGGELIRRILAADEDKARSFARIVLQPQSELYALRLYLRDHGYFVQAEDMLCEDGKFYTLLRLRYEGGRQAFTQQELKYGGLCLREKQPVLWEYLKKRLDELRAAVKEAELATTGRGVERYSELKGELEDIRKLLGG